jgi:hypothetical protein
MSRVRPFREEDIPEVARIHQAVFRPDDRGRSPLSEAYHEYLSGVFLTSPWRDPALPSLVFEDERGRVAGFIGVVGRTIRTDRQRLRAAVSCQFVVEPAHAAGLVAVRLAKAFLDGPQDLSLTDGANDAAKGMWEKLGGVTDRLLSLHWTRPLRPARLALSLLRNRRAFAPLAAVAGPFASLADGLAARVPSSQFRQQPPRAHAADLSPAAVLSHEPEFAEAGALRVEYDEPGLAWLLSRATRRAPGGTLRKAIVRRGDRVLGWYVCHLDASGTADVLHVAATNASIHDVLDRLFYDAWQAGAVALAGRLEPRFIQALSDKYCLLHRRGPWTLVHARCPDVLRAFWTGNVSFPRLDGEWCLAF